MLSLLASAGQRVCLEAYDRRVAVEQLPDEPSPYLLARVWLHSHPDAPAHLYSCNECSNIECEQGEYRSGVCTGTYDGFTCNNCSNAACPTGEYQTGTCEGENNGYRCLGCIPDCSVGFVHGQVSPAVQHTRAFCKRLHFARQ